MYPRIVRVKDFDADRPLVPNAEILVVADAEVSDAELMVHVLQHLIVQVRLISERGMDCPAEQLAHAARVRMPQQVEAVTFDKLTVKQYCSKVWNISTSDSLYALISLLVLASVRSDVMCNWFYGPSRVEIDGFVFDPMPIGELALTAVALLWPERAALVFQPLGVRITDKNGKLVV